MKNNLLSKAGMVFCALSVSGVGHSQIAASPSGYTMKMKWVKGAKMDYTMAMNMTGVPNAPAMKPIPFSMKVKDVQKGIATIEFTGANMPSGTTVKMDSSGKIVGGNKAAMGMSGGLTGASLPSKPVKVGETWKHTETTDTPMGKMKMSSTYKMLGVKTIAGKQVAEISMTISGGGQSMKIDGTGTMRLLMADSSLYSANLNQNMTMTREGVKGAPQKMKMTIAISRK